jgi:predicted PurR-regulated permease PerM
MITLLVVFIVGSSVDSFSNNLPVYEKKLNEQSQQFSAFLNSKGIHLKDKSIGDLIKPASAMKMAGDVLKGFSNLLANGFLILLLVIFMLLEASGFPLKMKEIYGADNSKSKHLKKFNTTVKRYMYLKSIISLATGVLVTLSLVLIGVDYPILWGLLSFAFNFIPNIGSIIAAVPPVLLSLIQLGPKGALMTVVCFIVINIFMGNVIEPRFMGKELGLSTLVVFLSLLFWGWVLGPVGMLLSVVLTMILKIMLDSNEATRHMALLLGPNPKE